MLNQKTEESIYMKKVLSVFLVIMMCMITVFTSACSPLDSEEEANIKNDIYDIYDLFRSRWDNAKDIEDIKESIKDWAAENEIACSDLGNDDLMLSMDATDDYTNAEGTMISCDICTERGKECSQCAAIALAAIKNSDEHGPVRVLFTASKNGEYYGAKALDKKYLSMDNFISMDYWQKTKMFTGSTSSTEYTFKRKIKRVSTNGTASYKINISGLEGGDSADRSRKHPNPLIALGDLLNSLNQAHLIFQVSGFNGGSYSGDYARKAEMIVTVEETDAEKLESRVNAKIDEFEEAYLSKEDGLRYTCAPCGVPKKSYSDEDTTNLISFFYTIVDGKIKASDDDDEDYITNVGYARDNGKTLTIKAKARALAKDQIADLTTSYQSTAKLAEFTLSYEDTYPGWPYRENSALIERFAMATKQTSLDLEPDWTYHENECAVFYEKKPALDMICIGANMDSSQELAQSLVLYLRSLSG